MNVLPKDLATLRRLLEEKMDARRRAKISFNKFLDTEDSEIYDKFIGEPVEAAKALNKSKEEIKEIRQKGIELYEAELANAKQKKLKELKVKDIKDDIKVINAAISKAEEEESEEKDQNTPSYNKFNMGFSM
ncbi:MAG: hypothetical protein AB7S44_03840 [Spirochaetales bacterium]